MNRIIGESGTLVNTLAHVSRVAVLDRPILIIGERGSGKELIAERLHFLSGRWQESFSKLNCAAISETLLDSELFGHEAGAFTGATKLHIGRFERADKGTLFLDELGTMPARIQEKLLRLIEYGEFERLGGSRTINVDVRIVAATHADLPALVEKGAFRADLLDRLAFDVVAVPPLRERHEDLAALVDHFGSKMSIEIERPSYLGFTDSALKQLSEYSWPGNIRELRNAVERSVCHWPEVDQPIDHVIINPFPDQQSPHSKIKNTTEKTSQHEANDKDDESKNKKLAPIGFETAVKNLELTLIRNALEANQHHQQRTADALEISYHQLRALLRKYKSEL